MKKILLILSLICMIIFPVFSQTGSLTTNEYFYLPEYGAYGTTEYDEYNTYMEVADNQIESNKDGLALRYLKTEMDSFSELQAIISDKTLVNEEDVFTIDANWVNTANPWADNEVDDDITIDLATLATTLTITDNESTNENNAILFTSSGDLDGGNLGIESDGTLHYNPSTGTITSTEFVGGGTGLTGVEMALTDEASLYSTLSDVSLFLEDTIDDTTPELGGELDAGAHSIGFTLQTATGDGTTTIDWRLGNKFQFTFGAQADTLTFTAPTNPGHLTLEIVQDGTGGRDLTLPVAVKWLGTEPTWTDGAGGKTIIMSMWYNGTYYWSQGTPWET